jgi:hypothetical protein
LRWGTWGEKDYLEDHIKMIFQKVGGGHVLDRSS